MKPKRFINLLLLILIFTSANTVLAQDEVPPCDGEAVSGSVVEVDEEAGTVIVDTGEGQCSVSLENDYDHPVIALLGAYFNTTSVDDFSAAMEGTQGWTAFDEEAGSWTWAAEGDEGASAVTVNSVTDNGDGTYTIEFTPEGADAPETFTTEDGALAESLSASLEALNVDWQITSSEDGSVFMDAGEQIAAYHEDGFGLGVLVKFYAMVKEAAEACQSGEDGCLDLSVEQLVEAFDSGTGVGQLFNEYGKPALLGVGHVRQAMDEKENKSNKPAKGYAVDGEVWVVYDEESEAWALADEGDEGALPAAILGVTDNGDGTQTLELSVEGVGGSVFLSVEARKNGKPDNPGKPDKEDNPHKPDKNK